MIVSRSTVDDALFSVIQGAYPWVYSSKHLQHWTQVDNQPAAFVRRIEEDISQKAAGAQRYVLTYEVWIYVQVDWQDPTVDIFDVYLNPILDAVDNAMQSTTPDGRNTLGGVVDNARISGKCDIADGSTDGQALMVIPIQVFVPGK
jgi:hypothetical protein